LIFSAKVYFNLLVFTVFLFFISRQNIVELGFLRYFNHIYIFIYIFSFVILLFCKPIKAKFIYLLVIVLLYSAFLVWKNNLPIFNMFQTLITLKYIFVFYIAANVFQTDRVVLFEKFTKILTLVLILSVVFTFTDYIFPNVFYDLSKDGRGLGGITPGSFFGSRVLYSGFLLLYSILLLSFKYNKGHNKYFIYSPKLYWLLLLLAFTLLFLTFSRKELVLLLIAYSISILYKSQGKKKLLGITLLIVLTPIVFLGLWFFIGESVQANLNEGYVRYKIFYYAMEIFEYYFPLGSGPGTYGTLMSKMYTDVYTQFNVDSAIIGYGSDIEGPIFDLFFVSLIAEYGLGFIFVIFLIFQPFTSSKDEGVEMVSHINLIRINAFLMLVGIGMMVPIMGNVVGLLLYFLLGIISSRGLLLAPNKKLGKGT